MKIWLLETIRFIVLVIMFALLNHEGIRLFSSTWFVMIIGMCFVIITSQKIVLQKSKKGELKR